jgi:hypothetical protein
MLHGDIEVRKHFAALFHGLKHLFGDFVGIHIQDADPANPFDPVHLTDEVGQHQPSVVVQTIFRGVLGNQSDFLNTMFSQGLDLFPDLT